MSGMAPARPRTPGPLAKVYGTLSTELLDAAIDYKDSEVLRRFLTATGRMKPRRATGLTAKQQRRLGREIKRARFMALLPYESEYATGGRRV